MRQNGLFPYSLLLPMLSLFFLIACGDSSDKAPVLATERQALNADSAVNHRLDTLMQHYFSLVSAFAYGIPEETADKARDFGRSFRQLDLEVFTGDSLLHEALWVEKENCLAENEAIIADPDMTEKRLSLNLLSGELYNLLRAVQYRLPGLCLMEKSDAFGTGKPGQWLTKDPSAPGPYPGNGKQVIREKWGTENK